MPLGLDKGSLDTLEGERMKYDVSSRPLSRVPATGRDVTYPGAMPV
jgi:hypothetical protein